MQKNSASGPRSRRAAPVDVQTSTPGVGGAVAFNLAKDPILPVSLFPPGIVSGHCERICHHSVSAVYSHGAMTCHPACQSPVDHQVHSATTRPITSRL